VISFIVPAHNEQASLGRTLETIHEAARAVGQPYEIIVVDDASTDATPEIVAQNNARVVSVNHRQIAATQNSGAHAALGERLFFVDADTTVNPQAVATALRYMDKGAVGGGAPARFDGEAPLYARLLLWSINWLMRLAEISGGAFMFATRDAFHAVGGFDERLYGAEDAAMSWALKREGRFVVIWDSVVTSGRRMRGLGGLRMLWALFYMAFYPRMLKRRASVKKVWYESDRGADEHACDSLIVRAINVFMLLVIIALLPIWMLVPSSLTPPGSFAGEIRYGAAILGCHVSLVLWPCAYFLCRSLIQQSRWIERVKLAALVVLCLWLAWGGTHEVVWFWKGNYGWVAESIFPGTA
jgi:cellulose synthase/poly-beta-1,6-N-acetylglucosamine synthase-like glycosyltransferase